MGKFNKPSAWKPHKKGEPAVTENFEGGQAYKLSPIIRLCTRVLTSLAGERKFYQNAEDSDSDIIRDIKLAAAEDPEFILQLAVFARNCFNLRSVPIMLLAEASHIEQTKPFVARYTPLIIKRADELIETVAYIKLKKYDGERCRIPACLKKGLGKAFENFDEYQLLKYDPSKGLRMRDIINLCHPKPADIYREALYGFLTGSLEADPDLTPMIYALKKLRNSNVFDDETEKLAKDAHATHELIIKKFGSTPRTWEAILPTMGYMAKLRNIYQLLSNRTEEQIRELADEIKNEKNIEKSRQLPFNYLAAYKSLKLRIATENETKINMVLDALKEALVHSVKNIEPISGATLIAIDVSGSMITPLSRGSSITYKDTAILLGVIGKRIFQSADVYIFAETVEKVKPTGADILKHYEMLLEKDVGAATNAYKIIYGITERKEKYDRIILLSDMQCYDSNNRDKNSVAEHFEKYRKDVNPDVVLYSIDLTGYGTSQIKETDPRQVLMSGWSDKIFHLINLNEMIRTELPEHIKTWTRTLQIK
ncbi:MAG: TROVE domain-containing protein [Firmicutes bacterium]|nr:TROVE domain-containing protein [Bacillota bacterium]